MVTNGLLSLSASDLTALKEALRTGRVTAPFLPALIERIVPRAVSADVSMALREMAAVGANREGLVAALEILAAARAQQPSIDELIELVTTGPEAGTVTNRDTQVVVQDLFRSAQSSILVAGYELYQAEAVFRTLADRMIEQPAPTVRMFLNVKRPAGNTSTDSELVAGFGYRFRTQHWPPDRTLPEIYFDPRSLSIDTKQRAVLHAKCVVIDGRTAFVSSANFTEAAQERNIEVGVLVRSQIVAERLTNFFAALISTGAVRRAL
jgi:phosphatidylserine/phosphatidylglycerophosphate/cardiolipin synthase-like enzyme